MLDRRVLANVVVIAVTGAAVSVSAVGCGTAARGLAGVSRSADGGAVVELAWCGEQAPSAVTVWHEDPTNTADPEVIDVTFRAGAIVGNASTIDLGSPALPWTRMGEKRTLSQGVTYSAGGFFPHNTAATLPVDFQLSDLDGLSTSAVRYDEYDQRSRRWRTVSGTHDEFLASARAAC